MTFIVEIGMGLMDEHVIISPVPPSCPVLVGPTDGKGKPNGFVRSNQIKRPTEESASPEPVVVEEEPIDSVFGS